MGKIQFLQMEEFISSLPSADALAGFAVIRKPGTERYRHCRQTFMAMGLVASALAGGDRHLLVFPAKVLKSLTENINFNHFNIVQQLGDLEYDGTLSLYDNNEPLLDKRMFEFAKLTRELVPRARLCIFTNGTLLTIDAFKRLIPVLDKLVIDNYSDALTMHANVRKVADYWRKNQIPGKEVRIIIRRETEVLTSRAGAAPNRKEVPPIQSSCLLPFVQMAVRPSGELGRCCADALGTRILGNLSSQSILDAWNSDVLVKSPSFSFWPQHIVL
jgi:hypothetical protein